MTTQPTFTNPWEAIAFIRGCLQQNDPTRLFTAFTQPPGEFWQDHLFQALRQIQETETLESVFLDDGRINTIPENENRFHLGGHDPRTHYIHIDLEKGQEGWVLKSILVCR